METRERNGLKGGSASDGQGGLHPIEVRASIGCAFACASNGSFQLHPMDTKSRKRRDRITRPPCASQHRRSAHAFNHHDNGFILTFRTYGRNRAGCVPSRPLNEPQTGRGNRRALRFMRHIPNAAAWGQVLACSSLGNQFSCLCDNNALRLFVRTIGLGNAQLHHRVSFFFRHAHSATPSLVTFS